MLEPSLEVYESDAANAENSAPPMPRSLKIEEWPTADQLAWKDAIRPALRLRRG
jgi:hypothetical protein